MAVRRVSFSEAEPEIREFVSEPHEPEGSDSEFEEEAVHVPCPVPRPLWELIKEKDALASSNGHLASEALGGWSFDPGPRPLWEMMPVINAPSQPSAAEQTSIVSEDGTSDHVNDREAHTVNLASWKTSAPQRQPNGPLCHKKKDDDARPAQHLKVNGTHVGVAHSVPAVVEFPQMHDVANSESYSSDPAPSKPPQMNGVRRCLSHSVQPISFDDEQVRQWLDCTSFSRLAKTSCKVWRRCVDDQTGLLLLPHVTVSSPETWHTFLTHVNHTAVLSAKGVSPSSEDAAGRVLAALKNAPHVESLDWTGPLPSPDVPRLHLAPFLVGSAGHLRALRLVGCDLGGPRAGCRYLSRALRNATRLESFDLSENAIDGTATIHIADLLARGVPTHTLVLDGNPLGEAGAEKLGLGLQCVATSHLRRLFLRGCGVPEKSSGALALAAAAEGIEVVLK